MTENDEEANKLKSTQNIWEAEEKEVVNMSVILIAVLSFFLCLIAGLWMLGIKGGSDYTHHF